MLHGTWCTTSRAVYQLYHAKSSAYFGETRDRISRLLRLTLQTGFLTSILALPVAPRYGHVRFPNPVRTRTDRTEPGVRFRVRPLPRTRTEISSRFGKNDQLNRTEPDRTELKIGVQVCSFGRTERQVRFRVQGKRSPNRTEPDLNIPIQDDGKLDEEGIERAANFGTRSIPSTNQPQLTRTAAAALATAVSARQDNGSEESGTRSSGNPGTRPGKRKRATMNTAAAQPGKRPRRK